MIEKKIVIAPDSFKGSLSSQDAAQAIKRGFEAEGYNNAECVPMADGGEGTVEAMIQATGGEIITLHVIGPMGDTGKSILRHNGRRQNRRHRDGRSFRPASGKG